MHRLAAVLLVCLLSACATHTVREPRHLEGIATAIEPPGHRPLLASRTISLARASGAVVSVVLATPMDTGEWQILASVPSGTEVRPGDHVTLSVAPGPGYLAGLGRLSCSRNPRQRFPLDMYTAQVIQVGRPDRAKVRNTADLSGRTVAPSSGEL